MKYAKRQGFLPNLTFYIELASMLFREKKMQTYIFDVETSMVKRMARRVKYFFAIFSFVVLAIQLLYFIIAGSQMWLDDFWVSFLVFFPLEFIVTVIIYDQIKPINIPIVISSSFIQWGVEKYKWSNVKSVRLVITSFKGSRSASLLIEVARLSRYSISISDLLDPLQTIKPMNPNMTISFPLNGFSEQRIEQIMSIVSRYTHVYPQPSQILRVLY